MTERAKTIIATIMGAIVLFGALIFGFSLLLIGIGRFAAEKIFFRHPHHSPST